MPEDTQTPQEVIQPVAQQPQTQPGKKQRAVLFLSLLSLTLLTVSAVLGFALNRSLASQTPPTPTSTPEEATETKFTIPKNAVKISGCIPHEGSHWVEPQNLSNGPFYVEYNGQLTAIEYMYHEDEIPGKEVAMMAMPQAIKYMQDNKLTLSGYVKMLEEHTITLPDVKVKDMSIHWTPPHAGLAEPHVDVHLYVVDKAFRETICPEAQMDSTLPPELFEDLRKRGIELPGVPTVTQPAASSPANTRPATIAPTTSL